MYSDIVTQNTLKEISRQLKIANQITTLRDLYAVGDISKEEYVETLRRVGNTI